MRHVSLIIVMLLLLVQEAIGTCHVNCDQGYLGVCVERDGHCECSCIKEVSTAAAEVRAMLTRLGVSKDGIDKGVQLFTEKLNSGERTFAVTFTDQGSTVTIRATSGNKSNDSIIVT